MSSYKTFNGKIVTDEMIEEWGKQLDMGIMPGIESIEAKWMTPDEFADRYYTASSHKPEYDTKAPKTN